MKILYITLLAFESNNPANMANMALINGLTAIGCHVDTLSIEVDKNTAIFDSTIDLYAIENDYRLPLSKTFKYLSTKRKDNNNSLYIKIKNKVKRFVKKIYMRLEPYDALKSAIDKLSELDLPGNQYDVIISASDPLSSHLLAEKYIQKFGKNTTKWVQYWQDPMYMDITRNHLLPKILKKEENRMLSKADRIVYVSPLTKKVNEELYHSNSKKMFFVPPGYMKEKIYEINKINDKPILGYYGSYSSAARNIKPLYEAAKNNLFSLDIVGHGDVTINNTDNVSVSTRKTIKEIEERESRVDILVCICNHSGTQIPSKIYYYAATNKPILIILDGNAKEIRQFLEPFNRFIFCNNNVEEISNAIKEIKKGTFNFRCEPIVDFSSQAIAKKFIDIINADKSSI